MTVKRFRQIYKLKVTANQKRIDLVENKTIKSVTRTEIEQLPMSLSLRTFQIYVIFSYIINLVSIFVPSFFCKY